MSITTTSPLSITRSDTSWCGLAPFGPEPTITNAAVGVALLDDRRGDVGPDLPLGAARLEELGHPGVHPVDRRAGRAQLGDLGGVLAHPQLAQHRAGQRLRASGSASRIPNTCAAGIESATATRVGPPARSLISRYGSSPSVQVTTSTPRSARPSPASPGASSRGTTTAGGARCPVAGSTRQVSRSWLAPVAPIR